LWRLSDNFPAKTGLLIIGRQIVPDGTATQPRVVIVGAGFGGLEAVIGNVRDGMADTLPVARMPRS
jgi:NADPH-dependent 2,4-dienoyl-CoA reductase/sulfur reductase-like enzyme